MPAQPVSLAANLDALSAFAARPPGMGAQTLARSEDALRDTLACCVAGRGEAPVLAVAETAAAGEILSLGPARRLAPVDAALVGGTAAHALDFDDNFLPSLTHASAISVPALFTIGQLVDAGSDDLLRAHVLSLELQARLAILFGPETYARGWHTTSSLGPIGVAGAAAALLGLDAAGIRAAMGIASSMVGGSKVQFGSAMKPVHAGLGASSAVRAALMARAGLRCADDPLGGPMGLVTLMSDPPSQDVAQKALDGFGAGWMLDDVGLLPKKHPCCGAAHRALDAILDLRPAFAGQEIMEIAITVSPGTMQNLRYDDPQTPDEARFSLTWPTACVALRGALSLSDMTPTALADPATRAMMKRVRPQLDPEGSGTPDWPARVEITLADGRCLTAVRQAADGSGPDPLPAAASEMKLADCCHWGGLEVTALMPLLDRFGSLSLRGFAAQLETVGHADLHRSHC